MFLTSLLRHNLHGSRTVAKGSSFFFLLIAKNFRTLIRSFYKCLFYYTREEGLGLRVNLVEKVNI